MINGYLDVGDRRLYEGESDHFLHAVAERPPQRVVLKTGITMLFLLERYTLLANTSVPPIFFMNLSITFIIFGLETTILCTMFKLDSYHEIHN